MNTQDQTFLQSEGDRFFQRNAAHFVAPPTTEADLPLRLLELYRLQPRRVLEIGGANGFRVAALAQRHDLERGVSSDASAEACADGRNRYPEVSFVHAEAAALPLAETFDLVIVNFVLHWIDRAKLLAVAAEVDRLIAPDGYLLLGDFDPGPNFLKVRYHHREDEALYTFKQDYAALFLASGVYERIGTLSGHYSAQDFVPAPSQDDRLAVSLLRKRGPHNYRDATKP